MRAETSVNKINRFMTELGEAVRSPGRIYFTGGVTAVALGWRETTLDVKAHFTSAVSALQKSHTCQPEPTNSMAFPQRT